MLCTAVNEPLSIIVNTVIFVIFALSCSLLSVFDIISLMKSLASVQRHKTVQYQAMTEPFVLRKAETKSLK